MKCRDTETLIKKYELGEIDFVEKMILKSHLKRCPVCRKRYASIIALGLLLTSSKKAFSPSLLYYAMQGTLLNYLAGLVLVGTIGIALNINSDNKDINIAQDLKQNVKTESIEIKEIDKNETENITANTSSSIDKSKSTHIKIRSRQDGKELEMNVDGNNNMQIKSKE